MNKNEKNLEDFTKNLQLSNTIEIDPAIKNKFENECLKQIRPFAKAMHKWREESSRSTTFVF